jgi:predicted P-loop ATPase
MADAPAVRMIERTATNKNGTFKWLVPEGMPKPKSRAATSSLQRPRRTASNADAAPKAAPTRYSYDASAVTLDGNWTQRCRKGGKLAPDLANVMVGLRRDPDLHDLLTYDELLRAPVLMKDIADDPSFSPRPLTDADVAQIQEIMQLKGLRKIPKDVMHQAIALRARERPLHPIRDYLDDLQWDGEPRLATWLSAYAGAEQTEYAAAVGRMFIVAMVARIYQPGCQSDYMLILEGEQGELKSSLCRVLAGEQYFDDQLDGIGTKEASQHLRGKWLLEIAEMHAFNKHESALLKSFVTRRVERYRPPFGRLEVFEPRQCLFIGTTNERGYLKDPTGNRRYWPIACGSIDIDALKRDRDQLFAEAVHRYRAGEQWWPTRDFEREHIAPEQEARQEHDAWEEPVHRWLEDGVTADGVRVGREQPLARTTISDLALDALGIHAGRMGTADQRRLAAVLTSLGWRRGKRQKHGRYWEKGDAG